MRKERPTQVTRPAALACEKRLYVPSISGQGEVMARLVDAAPVSVCAFGAGRDSSAHFKNSWLHQNIEVET